MDDRFGAVEAGGTKFVVLVGSGPEGVLAEERIETESPEVTLPKVVDFFRRQIAEHGPLRGIGIGSFGPVDPRPGSKNFGSITTTPKPGWANVNLVAPLAREFGVPVAFDTDVNAAAVGEHRWGAARGLDTFLYITVGTGIGGGGLVEGKLMHGLVHPEMGHLRLPRDRQVDPFDGACPYHGDCWEGLAAGPAMEARWGKPAEELPQDHPAWKLEVEYMALALHNLICTLSPQRIVLGGGVMQQDWLLPAIRARILELLAGYVQSEAITSRIDEYIVSPGLGNRAGALGALALAGAGMRGVA
jgi:fructokinase